MPNGICLVVDGKIVDKNDEHKGKSLIAFPDDFCVVDLETTGLSPDYDDIIEISALRVRGGQVVDSFSTLVKPLVSSFFDLIKIPRKIDAEITSLVKPLLSPLFNLIKIPRRIDAKITSLTGITNKMLASAPTLADVLPAACDFIGNDILVGSNVGFDVNFLYKAVRSVQGRYFSNDYVDTVRIARIVFPALPHHRLCDVAAAVGIFPKQYHRALDDCQTTFECFRAMHDRVVQNEGMEAFIRRWDPLYKVPDLRTITAQTTVFDETHPLFGKRCAFTGLLKKMTNVDAAQLIVNAGGICDNNVTMRTNFLILGNNDHLKPAIKDGKSVKQRKAEDYKQRGLDIEVIPEEILYNMLGI